jgi:3-oxoacyl-[acyl-carrier-protein] synthase II
MGVVSPNGIGKEAFCRAVLAGTSGVKRISLFDPSKFPAQIAGEVCGFRDLDWVEPRERKHMARTVPMAIAAATEALADTDLDTKSLSKDEQRQVGIVLGSGGGTQEFSEQQYKLWFTGHERRISIFTIASSTLGTLSSELSLRFGFRGISHVVSTGCASSTDAIGYAMKEIRHGSLSMVLTGGTDSQIAPGLLGAYCQMRALSTRWNHEPHRASRPFSSDRDGFVLAEGAWMFVLEDYDHARARGARVYAEIAGYGSTCEAYDRVRLNDDGEEPARAITMAMADAGISGDDVDYVNLHGTSTEMNDRVETRALKLALGDRARNIPMSALKSQIGHPQGASGSAGMAATLVAMEHAQLPPTINLDQPDPQCDLDYVPQAGRQHEIEHAVCNCIAFGSKNSALVLRRI